MNKFTKIIVSTFFAIALSIPAFAADTSVKATNAPPTSTTNTTTSTTIIPPPAAPTRVQNYEEGSLFNAGEFGLSLGLGYAFGKASEINGKSVFHGSHDFNINAGGFYFPWRNVGFEANLPFYHSKGVSIDEVQVGSLFRFPLSKTESGWKNIAPYVGLGGVNNWQTEKTWAYIAKIGTEFRLNKDWGFFIEGQYRNSSLSHWGQGQTTLNGGLRIAL